jgi:hypothetical protein
MPPRKFNVIIWLVKAAELDDVKKCCLEKLAGLRFDLIYSLPYAMCLNTVSEIMTSLEIEDDQSIIATSRFSSIGVASPEELEVMLKKVADFVKKTPITVDVWQEVAPDYVEPAIKKAKNSIAATFMDLSKKPSSSLSLLVISNDRLPLLELLTIPLNKGLRVPLPGELVQLRFEVQTEGRKVHAKLVYARHEALE